MVKRKGSGKRKACIILCLVLIAVLGVWLYFRSNINPIVIRMSEATVKSVTNAAVNEAVYAAMDGTTDYDDLVEVVKDNDGKIAMVKANSVKINRLARVTEKQAEENLAKNHGEVISIPIGAFTGSKLMADKGPAVEVKILPIAAVSARFLSEFQEAGINQTRHKIYLEVATSVNLIIPSSTETMQCKTQVLIAETILVGSVPEVYLKFSGANDLLNLVPQK